MIKKEQLLLFLMAWCLNVSAQQVKPKIPDSLCPKKYSDLSSAVLENENDSIKSKVYAQAWLNKAKADNNYSQLAQAYKTMLYKSDKKLGLYYADSMLTAAIKTSDKVLIGSAYMTKATVFYGREQNKQALDNFILADKYIAYTNDKYSIYKVKFGIAQTKYYLGFYDEAIALLKECIDYFKEENDRAYLNSLHSLSLCYNRLGKYDLCTATNQFGLEVGLRLENVEMNPYFIHSEGVNQFGKHNYKEAISKLTTTLPTFIKNKDFANQTVAYFYLGKCYWALNQQGKAMVFFKKMDTVFDEHKYIRPDLREGYELLIDYYKNQNEKESQLLYINKLMQVDHFLNKNYQYLVKKVVKEYDTKQLVKSKQDIENAMAFRTIIGVSIIILMAFIIIYLIYRHFKNKRLFEEVMKRNTAHSIILEHKNEELVLEANTTQEIISPMIYENNNKQQTQEISLDIEAAILKNLEKFESNKKYLERDMTLAKMATLLHTNSKYVTKVIAKHRNKGTIEYITDLKIDYIIECLKTENKFRNYTNKALADEAGFNSTQNFTKAFKTRTGISPTYFIYQLKKSIDTGRLQ